MERGHRRAVEQPPSVPDRVEANRALWDQRVPIHADSDWYDVAGFRQGRLALDDIELSAVPSARGASLLHLQCHFGLGTLSWARLGATVTGVDFSPEAVRRASSLAKELSLPAEFYCADVSRLELGRTFDVVFTSWGVLMWLPDLNAWAQTVAKHLRPGGRFFIAEAHPNTLLWDDRPNLVGYHPKYPYFLDDPIVDVEASTYVDESILLRSPQHRWNHRLSEIVSSLLNAGMRLQAVNEFERLPWRPFPWMVPHPREGFWRIEGDPIPLSFSISATRDSQEQA